MLDCFDGLVAFLAYWVVSFLEGGVGFVSGLSGVIMGESVSDVGRFWFALVVS